MIRFELPRPQMTSWGFRSAGPSSLALREEDDGLFFATFTIFNGFDPNGTVEQGEMFSFCTADLSLYLLDWLPPGFD